MNDKILFDACYAMASAVVRRYRAILPEGVEVLAFGGGGSNSSSSNQFSRRGTTQNLSYRNMPVQPANWDAGNGPWWADSVQRTASKMTPFGKDDTGLPYSETQAGRRDSFFHGLIDPDLNAYQSRMPSPETFEQVLARPVNGQVGRTQLESQATKDIYSSDYETATNARYDDIVARTLAQSRSGPEAVRGADNRHALTDADVIERSSLNRADELRRWQTVDSSIQQQAAQMLEAMEQGRVATQLGAQGQWADQSMRHQAAAQQGAGGDLTNWVQQAAQLWMQAANLYGDSVGESYEDLTGQGSQSGSTGSWSVNLCCFIFMEAYNGQLPPIVRRARDVLGTETTRSGYRRMANWLVPLMRKSTVVRQLVNYTMIKPLIKFGEGYFGEENATRFWKVFTPVKQFWFFVWNHTAK